jgi:aminopeptidase N
MKHPTLGALACLVALTCATLACRSNPPRAHDPGAGPSAGGAVTPSDADIPAPQANGRLPDLARPTRYALDLDVNPDEQGYSGRVRIDVEVARSTRALVLHARGLTITRAEITQGEGRQTATATNRMAAGGRESPEELVLTLPRALNQGAATVEIAFTGGYSPELRGLFHVREGERWYAFSDFEPTDARRAFPCFDEPGFKVPVEVAITAPSELMALSNMNEVSHTEDAARHTTTHRFAPSPPISTYLVAFAVGPFEVFEGATSPVPIRVIAPRGKAPLGRLAAAMANETLAYLGDWFARPYPYPKLDLVAVPDFGPGAMENPGLVTFRDAALLLDESRASARARFYMSSIVAHELAHQWFGDLVTMAWWDDLWLNEGFATWMGSKVMLHVRPAMGAEYDDVDSSAWARQTDGLTTAHAIRQRVTSTSEALESFDATTYSKGAAVLRMLEVWMGEEPFQRGIREYVRAHEWSNATASDLLASLSTAAGRDVSPVASTFLDQTGVPLVRVEVSCAADRKPELVFTQTRFAVETPAQPFTERWQMPAAQTGVPPGTVHSRPHSPQCASDVLTEVSQPLASAPSQLPKPALHVRHAAVPFVGDGQRIPHPPQCEALSVVLVSQPLVSLPSQLPKPATHAPTTQRPATHAGVALGRLHCVPHAPQFEALVWVLTHALPQHISPAGQPRPGPQPVTHAPSRQS